MRKKVRTVSFVTALCVVLAIWGAVSSARLVAARRELNAQKERALTSLGTYVDNISLNLDKSLYASSAAMMTRLANEVWRSSAAAKLSLSEITDGKAEVSGIYKFLSQAGEYSVALNKKLALGESVSEKELENLKKLNAYADNLKEKLNYLIEERQSGGLSFEKIKTTLGESESDMLIFGEQLESAAQTEEDYPTLIYDGPYSDHIESSTSSLLNGLDEISKSEAQKKAAEFLEISPEELYFLSESSGNLPCYTFYNSTYTASVTKKGGMVSYVLSAKYAGESEISPEEAVNTALKYLKKRGYTSVKDTYYAVSDGICTVNFAYFDDDIIYYPDLVKVSVSLSDGTVTAFEATGYLMNHKVRNALKAGVDITMEDGEKRLNKSLGVKNARLAVIPTDYLSERFVYEYHTQTAEGKELLIYIDPKTGEEADILELLYYDGGVLTR